MITDILITFAYTIINAIINIFPTSTGFSGDVNTAFTALGGYVGIWKSILPISTLATCLSLVIGIELSVFLFKTLKWIISHIPQIGGKGN